MKQDFSFWEFEAYHQRWDVCIIGAGISGISTGISLLERKPDLKVLVVDRWFISLGASTRNAGFSTFGSPSEILEDIQKMGELSAVSLVQKRYRGLEKLRSRLDLNKVRFETLGGYELFHPSQFEEIAPRLSYLNQLLEEAIGHKNLFTPSPVPNGIRGFTHALFNPLDGQLHPGYMMQDLTTRYLALGGKIHMGWPIETIEEADDHIRLVHPSAIPILASKVVVTTNAFARQLLPDLDVHGARNHVLVTSPVGNLPWKGSFHYDKGFYYFRNIGNRVLLGGARNADLEKENTDQFGRNPVVLEALQDFLYTHLADPTTCRMDYQWSGIIGIGSIKSPIIARVRRGVYVGVRLSGIGIALASLLGEELSELVLQQE